MLRQLLRSSWRCCWAAFVASAAASAQAAEAPVDYNRDIRPILSDRCYNCHGPDEQTREAGLRLDLPETAYAEADSGSHAIVPGKPEESELLARVTSSDSYMRMPPEDSGVEPLSAEQIELLRRWIADGAEFRPHWSFVPPTRPTPPETKSAWGGNEIDAFVLARLEEAGLVPSPEADKATLLRRVTYDLTGLPPTLAEIEAFLADDSADAYEKVVDRLLASPHYGEHMARDWLDAARYGDTHGLHLDNVRSIWPYRDWVIRAFNQNKPFDEFTVEQLAGDLLPEPTVEQRVATGFNRCNVTTSEGGSIAEEFYVRYTVDRVETTATVWMGLTAGCAVCHDHKFDPITQKEFYQLFAFFNNITERAMDGNALLPPPSVQMPSDQQRQQQKQLQAQIAQLEQQVQTELAKIDYQEPSAPGGPTASDEPQEFVWIDEALPAGAQPTGSWNFTTPSFGAESGSLVLQRKEAGLSQVYFLGAAPALQIGAGDKLFAYVYLDPADPPRQIMWQFNNGSWDHRVYWGENLIEWGTDGSVSRQRAGDLPEPGKWTRLEIDVALVGLQPGDAVVGWAFTQFDGTSYWDKAGLLTHTPQGEQAFASLAAWIRAKQGMAKAKAGLPEKVFQALKAKAEKRSEAQTKLLRDHFLQHVYPATKPIFAPLHEQLTAVRKELETLEKEIPATLVMKERDKRRDAFILIRGEYDKKGEKVEPDVPRALPPLPDDAPRNRLGFARWLVSGEHPLTARVAVNRYWQHYFGTGLVKTSGDFGSQGEWPSHPQLLDWLASEFVDSGWDIKHMQRLIVLSATYRQSSKVTPELLQRDPANRLLARGPRFRMDAEMIRDTALALSGLLVSDVGGESVKPYQPPGIWEAVGYTGSNTARFEQDHGAALYRRSMYTFWKRTAPPPSMQAFDAPSREYCVVQRSRTNTPLAALVLLNDVQFVEAARNFAERIISEGGATPEARARFAFQLATARLPSADELRVLVDQYHKHHARYESDLEAARKLLASGESKRDESLDVAEHAAWTMVANLILNLDETITKG